VRELRYFNTYLYKYKYRFILGISLIIGTHVFSIIPARLVKHMFDFVKDNIKSYQILQDSNTPILVYKEIFQGLLIYSILIILASLTKSLCSFLLRQAILGTANEIEYTLKNEIYNHYQTLPLSFYKKYSTGDLMTRISEDVTRVKMYLGLGILFGLNAVILFVILLPYMFAINSKLTLVSMSPLPFLALGIYYGSGFLHQRAEKLQSKLAKLTSFVQESFSGIRILQAFSREDYFKNNFSVACEDYKNQAISMTAVNAIFLPLAIGVTGLGIITTVYFGGQEVIKGKATTGTIAEFIMYMHLITWPVLSISIVTNFVQRAAASQKRINEFLQIKNHLVSSKNIVLPLQGDIAFKNVSFIYPDSGIQALDNISFQVPAGQSIAIVGTTGSGKSTIANLLVRLYDANQGIITIDDRPNQVYNLDSLRQQIGYIPQEVVLFSDTIQNNIAFGKPEASHAQIVEAAHNAGLYPSIQRLPKSMETVLGERGINLSGGQKQRIAIARALLREPRILILDDSLSAVDAKTESSILQTLAKVMQGKTTVLISHRVSVASLAKQILVLDAGKVVEQGTQETLLLQKGIYYSLYQKQKIM
jgi:ATP-binding cassette subfamily B multidrug efflux pump